MNGQPAEYLLGLNELKPEQIQHIQDTGAHSVIEVFLRMVPPNIIVAAHQGQLLGLITFSIIIWVWDQEN